MKNTLFVEIDGMSGIKKLLISLFVVALFITAPSASFASEDKADVISEETDEFFDSIVNPMYIPCSY